MKGIAAVILTMLVCSVQAQSLCEGGCKKSNAASAPQLTREVNSSVQAKSEVAYSICQTVSPVGGADYPVANAIYPNMATANYFGKRGIPLGSGDSLTVLLVEAPKHGELKNGKVYGAYLYNPNKGYLGADRMIFSVEVNKKVFKVNYSVDVVEAPDSGSPNCPTGNGIQELNQ